MFGDPSMPTHHGAAFLALDVAAMSGGADVFSARVQALIDEIHAAPTAEGIDRVLLPGEREWAESPSRAGRGDRAPADVIAAIGPLAAELGLSPDWLSRQS